jgi:hypothetical protein
MAVVAEECTASAAGECIAPVELECAASAEDVRLQHIAPLRWESPVSRQGPLPDDNLAMARVSRLSPDPISVARKS